MGPTAALLSDGKRLHLQHGPIDLIIGAEGDRKVAFTAAQKRFSTVLGELVCELPLLRSRLTSDSPTPVGAIAKRMDQATRPLCKDAFITSMAAVAGSVADEVLGAMCAEAELQRAYVNNGGDIALHLAPGEVYTTAMASHDGRDLGRIRIQATDPVRGIATSGRHGRSLSLGIADSVTVLAPRAAQADAAATLIANKVDLPGHPAVRRCPAIDVIDDSDLGDTAVVTGCGPLISTDVDHALNAGLACADSFVARNFIIGASLFLQNDSRTLQARDVRCLEKNSCPA